MERETLNFDTEGLYVLYELFHENTKMDIRVAYDNMRRMGAVGSNPMMLEKMAFPYKTYPFQPRVPLVEDLGPTGTSFDEAVLQRRSIRVFTGEKLSLEEISRILYFGYGITNKAPLLTDQDKFIMLRAAASAGALYPLEFYPLILNAEIEAGLYHFNIKSFCLELLKAGDFREQVPNLFQGQQGIEQASMIILISGIMKRTTVKYGNRGYRFVLLDAGHAAQNIYLTAAAIDLGCYTIGGFSDRELEDLLGIDGVNESILYAAAIGRPDKDAPQHPGLS